MIFENEEGEESGDIELDSSAAAEDNAPENDGADDISQHEEAAAKARGWVPKDQFRGRAEDWQDAKSFLDRAASLKSEVEELRQKVSAQEETYAERIRRIEAANERIMRDDRERLVRELRQAKRVAVELGDTDEFDRLEAEEDKYYQRIAEQERELEQPAQRQPAPPKLLPETEDWIRRNSWFNENQAMQQIALGFYNEAMEGMPATKDETKRLAYVEKRMAHVYPDKFGSGNRANSVEGGSRGMATNAPITKLTAEERAACRKFISRGIIKNEAEYIKYLNEYE